MRKLIAAINMTLDGFCNHTAMRPDDAQMEHYNELYRNADLDIFGRTTFQLMEGFWPEIAAKQNDDKLSNEFAVLIDDIPKIVYSRTLDRVEWRNTELKHELVAEDIVELKQREGKNILVGSPSLIVQLTNLGLIDEYQLSVHPTILGSGLPLFKDISERVDLKLLSTKTFGNGAVLLCYEPEKQAA
ncbi:MAG: dihydrofolate reductase family protein [Candidatus Saccharibacteria bacterium]